MPDQTPSLPVPDAAALDTAAARITSFLRLDPGDRTGAVRQEILRIPNKDFFAALKSIADSDPAEHADIRALPPEAFADLWQVAAEKEGGTRQDTEDHEMTRVAATRDASFGERFALLVETIPAPSPAFAELPHHGRRLLLDLCDWMPSTDSDHADLCRQHESFSALDVSDPVLADALARRGLTPRTFLDACHALGESLRRARRNGSVEPVDACVHLSSYGRFEGDSWKGDPEAPEVAVMETCELPEITARALVVWIAASASVQEYVVHRHRAEPVPGVGVCFAPITRSERRAHLDGVRNAWSVESVERTTSRARRHAPAHEPA